VRGSEKFVLSTHTLSARLNVSAAGAQFAPWIHTRCQVA
jgi:hypothetical protein